MSYSDHHIWALVLCLLVGVECYLEELDDLHFHRDQILRIQRELELQHLNKCDHYWHQHSGRVLKRQLGTVGQNENIESLKPVAGLELLGRGIDLKYDIPQGLRPLLFDWTYNRRKKYDFVTSGTPVGEYISDEDFVFRIPDQVDLRYIAQETSETMEFQDYQSFADSTNKEKRKSVNALVVKIKYYEKNVKRNLEDSSNVMVRYVTSSELFEIIFNEGTMKRAMTEKGKRALLTAVEYPFSALPEAYFNFIEKYGTHFISSAKLGASITVDSSFENTSNEFVKDFNLNIGISIGGFFIPFEISIDITYKEYEQRISFRSSSSSSMFVLGGVPDNTNLAGILAASTPAEVVQTRQLVQDWKKTIGANPVMIDYQVDSWESLVTNPRARQDMNTAINCYYNEGCYLDYLRRSHPEF